MAGQYEGNDADNVVTRWNGPFQILNGYGGNDDLWTLYAGQVTLNGGDGDDYLRINVSDATENSYGTYGRLIGGNGNDRIVGGSDWHGDTLEGGAGDDWVEGGPSMADSTVNYGVNFIDGGDGRDRLVGNSGNDTIYGGEGDDSGGEIRVGPYGQTTRPGLYGDTGNDHLDGGDGNDYLDGGADDDTMIGGTGHDTLNGAHGADSMAGGLGDDVYTIDSASDTVTELANEGTDTVETSIDYTLGATLENLILTGGAVRGTGNALANVMVGNAGLNVLEGGAGDDTYLVDNTGDVVIEAASSGVDMVSASQSFTLGANIEILTLTGSAVYGIGNASDNAITGNALANTLNGGRGADTLAGGAGHDSYVLDSAADILVEAVGYGTDSATTSVSYTLRSGVSVETLSALAGTKAIHLTGNSYANALVGNNAANTLNGASGNDKLTGGLGNDKLLGGYHNDMLIGGRGKDLMTGGSGKDRFVFDDRDTSAAKTSADYILDFNGRAGDRIDLKLVDGNAKTVRDDPFAFIGTGAFTKAGQVRYEKVVDKAGSYTYVYLNTDADASAEAVIKLKGAMDLVKGWFIL